MAWSPVQGVSGYKLYVRAGSAPYGAAVDLGAKAADADGVVRAVRSGLAVDQSYAFAVTSYGSTGESDLSNELSVRVTASPTPIPTVTRTPTRPPAATATATVAKSTPTRTATRPFTPTRTPTRTFTPTRTPTWTFTPTRTATTVPAQDVTDHGAIIARVIAPLGGGNKSIEIIRDHDMPPVGTVAQWREYDTWDGPNAAASDYVGYAFPATYRFSQVLFQEGMHFWDGGWLDSLAVQVYQNGTWVPVRGTTMTPAYRGGSGPSFAITMISFTPITGSAIRVYGAPGGAAQFMSVAELRVYGAGPLAGFSRSADRSDGATSEPLPSATPTATAIWTPNDRLLDSDRSVWLGAATRDDDDRVVVPLHANVAAGAHEIEADIAFDTRRLDVIDLVAGPSCFVTAEATAPGRLRLSVRAGARMADCDPAAAIRFAADAELPATASRVRLVRASVDGELVH